MSECTNCPSTCEAVAREKIVKGPGVYRITFIGDKKQKGYVGVSKNIHTRLGIHINSLKRNRHKNLNIQNAFNTWGCEGLRIEVLAKAPVEYLYKLEKHFIQHYGLENLYNIDDAKVSVRNPRVGPKVYKEIVEQYNLGYTIQDCAKIFKISPGTVKRALKKHAVTLRPSHNKRIKVKDEDYKDIVKRVRGGEQLKDIAKTYNCHPANMTKFLKKRGFRLYRKITEEEGQNIITLKSRGLIVKQIASSLGLKYNQVRRFLDNKRLNNVR